jgi:energy-coupling factor transporter transmembrane protein EcfT
LLHRLDPRVKVVAVPALAVASSLASGMGIVVLTAYVACLCGLGRLSPARVAAALRPLAILVLLVIVVRTAAAAGQYFSIHDILEGLRFGWRILSMAAAATLFLSTTKLTGIKAAVAGLLGKLPGVPAGRIALMVGLTLGSLPELADRLAETRSARLARLIDLRRDPFSRIQSLVVPLGRRLLGRADETVFAMEARCYIDETTPPSTRPVRRDWAALAVALLVPAVAIFL